MLGLAMPGGAQLQRAFFFAAYSSTMPSRRRTSKDTPAKLARPKNGPTRLFRKGLIRVPICARFSEKCDKE
jgi:hypothetical protein